MTSLKLAVAAAIATGLAMSAAAQTKEPAKEPPKAAAKEPAKTAKEQSKPNRVKYACDGGVNLTVTYPASTQANPKVKLIWNDQTYFLRPVAAGSSKYANKNIKLEWATEGEVGTLQKAGEKVADKCKGTKA